MSSSTEVTLFYDALEAKFSQICELLARELGHGDFNNLSDGNQERIEEEAENNIEQWYEGPELEGIEIPNPTPLQRLLAEFTYSENEIIDREDGLRHKGE